MSKDIEDPKELRIAGVLRDHVGVRNLSATALADTTDLPRETFLNILRGANQRMEATTASKLIVWLFSPVGNNEKTARISGHSNYTPNKEEIAAAVEIIEPTVRRKRSRSKKPDDVSDRLKNLVSTKYGSDPKTALRGGETYGSPQED